MFFVSDIYTTPPDTIDTPLQREIYRVLQSLHIPFERVETEEAITMEDCVSINRRLDVNMVKTLFLCNRQQTAFYLFITTGDKPFQSKSFSNALGVSRVSFAPAKLMEQMLGTKIGAATIFSVLLDESTSVRIVIDRDVAAEEWYGCSDGTTTGYVKLKTAHVIHAFLPYAGHTPSMIEV